MIILQLTTNELTSIIRNALDEALREKNSRDLCTFNLTVSDASALINLPEGELLKLVVCRKIPHVLIQGDHYFNKEQLLHWKATFNSSTNSNSYQ